MKNIKYFKNFESTDWDSENNFVHDLEDITLELKDDGFLVDIRINKCKPTKGRILFPIPSEYEVRISKPGFNTYVRYGSNKKDLIKWSEIKDTIIRLTEYCYDNNWSVRFWGDGVELKDFKKEEDFTISDDTTNFTFRMLITRL